MDYFTCRGGWGIILVGLLQAQSGWAAPSVADALQLKPVQAGIQPARPTAEQLPACSIRAEKIDGTTAWVVRNSQGEILRQFADSNADNIVDTWSYFRGGLEIYRDIDSNFNGKADQHRWFHWEGTRWGLNTDEDPQNTIDSWKRMSPEEAAEQVVVALRTGDVARFDSLLVTPAEIGKLGLAAAQVEVLTQRSRQARSMFEKLVASGKIDQASSFSDFGGLKPGLVPAGTHGVRKDLLVYENTWAMISTGEEHQQLQLGTMVSVQGVWKLIDGPLLGHGQETHSAIWFGPSSQAAGVGAVAGMGLQPTEKVQKLLSELEQLDQQMVAAGSDKKPTLNAARAKLLRSIADMVSNQSERNQWLKQLADMVSAAAQDGSYPQGVAYLKTMERELQAAGEPAGIVAYFEFHRMMAEYYGVTLAAADVDFAEAQAQWQKDLAAFIERHPQSEHRAEALRMLAINSEMSGDTQAAVKWYRQILTGYPHSPVAAVAQGAVTRITSEGRAIRLQGTAVRGGQVDLRDYLRRVVIIQYWTTSSPVCQADHAVLGDLYKKYGGARGLEIIGVNLDFVRSDLLSYLKAHRLPWKQLFEPGGFDGRLAREMGVVTVPLMLLVGPDGKVISNNIQAAEIEAELKKLLPAATASR